MKIGLDDIDRKLLNLVQGEFPLTREPFSALGLRLGISTGQVMHRIEGLKREGIVRLIGPVFNARSLGYQTTLVAMRVAKNRLDKATRVISEHQGVSHCYKRGNSLNLWFTLALPSKVSIKSELQRLSGLIHAETTLDLPALRIFKIGAYFDALGDGGSPPSTGIEYSTPLRRDSRLSPIDRILINELQQDLPIVERPFNEFSGHLNMDIDKFLDRLRSLQQRGIMRRFGAAIKHDSIGLIANAMACWIAPPDIVEVAGQKLAAIPGVSHCYERKTNPLWPYNLFAMIHGHTKEACQNVANQVSRDTGLKDYVLLFSVKELKKVRVKYLV